MPDTFERVLWVPGPSAEQSFVNIEFRDDKGKRQMRTLPLLNALQLARELEEIWKDAAEKGWL